ncbi:hypothetical protein L6452_28432 [Arctium lappa]|uniref:Uncharacterized protein n=1 Tax=Arctium lappa TaxID=4217 RepID=A0ACB8ZYP1_ARCLA|nr:hypothetical protein L6452_28432 [Arctium lappa]
MVVAFLVAVVLDNTVPGSRQERGVYVWSEPEAAQRDSVVAKDYGLPFRLLSCMMVVLSEISASSSSTYHYDVFLSFRGADTRYGFTDHLHKALLDAAIDTFFYDVEIQTGEDLKPELENAIKTSRASVIVLSKDYASSTWCLDELVLILEQRRSSKHIVIPIFYHVKPTDVRKQQSSFGDAMARHKQKMEAEPNEKKRSQLANKMKNWEKALTEVADLKGEEANGRRETILIERIVKEINSRLELNKQSKIPLLIGMESSVRTITSFLKDDATEILTIWGMGGIGKTHLSNYVFKLHYRDFERSSFLEDIERRCMQPNKLLDLQKQLLKDIGDITWMDIHDANVAASKIEKLLLRKKTLLVLDGIDHFEQLDMLVGTRGFLPGSKIIITTKDASLIEKCGLFMSQVPPKHMMHLLKGLDHKESLQLLGLHAFNGDYPNKRYRKQARKVVKHCGGHPLALKVSGSSLRKQDVAAWKDALKLLQKETNPKIQQVLQISFDSLPSNNDKELFKHIACFFIGKDSEFAEAILRKCDMIPTFGLSNLIDRCLLEVGLDNELRMHQLLQELGRDLVRQESPNEPWERSRIWHHEESYDVLKQEKGTAKIQGLVLDMKMIENYTSHRTSTFTMERFGDDLRRKIGARPLLHRVCDIFSWIWCLFAWVFLLRSSYSNELDIKTNAFIGMDKLRILQLNYVQLHGSYKHFPTCLRWLSMHGFPLSYLPLELQLGNLVALDMSYSNLQYLWKKPKLLRSLKFLILSCCHELVSVGGFDGFPLLERLILAGCVSLVEVCESIGNCDRLLLLDLSECGNLKKLPRSIRKLKNLRTLSIDGCSNHGEFPVGIKDMEPLEVLKADNVNIESQVSSSSSSVIVVPRSLKSSTISLPGSLVSLSLRNNKLSNESFPVGFGSLSMLEELDLGGNQIDSLPDCVRSLSRLRVLNVEGCGRLKTVLCAPRTLEHLNFPDCVSLQRVTFHPAASFPSLHCEYSKTLTEIEGVFKKQAISEVDEEMLRRLGWINRQHVKDDKFPTMSDLMNAQGKTFLVQMIDRPVVFSTYFQGNRLPDWVTHISCSSELHFTLPSYGKSCRIRGLNVCFVTNVVSSTKSVFPSTTITNSTKRYSDKIYVPRRPVALEEGDIVWLSHWMLENEFKDGDEVSVYVDHPKVHVKEFGVSVVYDDDDDGNRREDPLADYKSLKLIHRRGCSLCL